MSAGSSPVPIEALLAHQGFVRALARQLVRDPHAAEDVAQETWIEAARARKLPRSLRGWLAEIVRTRASNRRRADVRRLAREHTAARTESVEAHDVVERVELESRVVRAVLALREPYRGVILGRYYENADTAELARRQGVTESSVRSQETRALELLRRELDETFDSGRAAWSAIVAPLGQRETAITPPLVATGVVIAVIALGVTALELRSHSSKPERTLAVVPNAAPEPEPDAGQSASVTPRATREQAPVASAAPSSFGPAIAELSALDVSALLRLALQTQAALRAKLLTPDPAELTPYAGAIARGELAAVRILEAETFGSFGRHDLLGIEEGGSRYTFVDRTHASSAPDLALLGGAFRAQTHEGLLADLGECDLDALPASGEVFLPAWDEATRSAWSLGWTKASGGARGVDDEFRRRAQALRSRGGSARESGDVGHTFLLRSLQGDERDVLVAFRCVSADAYGRTLVWRKLREWPVRSTRGAEPDSRVSTSLLVGPAPEWLAAGNAAELLALLERVRDVATPRVTAIPPEHTALYEPWLAGARGGLTKLVSDETLSALVEERRGASLVNLLPAPAKDDVRSGGMLQLSNGSFFTGTSSGVGWILDLGDVPFAEVSSAERVPASLDPEARVAWTFLWYTLPDEAAASGTAFSNEAKRRASALQLSGRATAHIGHTYLVRTVGLRSHDLTAAVRVVARDDYGLIVAWRVLRELAPPGKPR